MPLTYRIDLEANMIFVLGEGALTQADKIEGMRAWMADPDYRPGLNVLFDFAAVTTPGTREDLQQTVAFIARKAATIGRKKVALVMASPLAFGVARQFHALLGETALELDVFKSRDEALAWLRTPSKDAARQDSGV